MGKYLVTGGCGFIGSHLVERLRADGHEVTVLDNLSTGDRNRLASGVRLVVGDVRDGRLLRELTAGGDGVFHLAAVASVERCNREWVESHSVNLTGTVAVFEAARDLSLPVVWASSAAVYGDQERQPIDEQAIPSPRTPYGADKRACELHGEVAARLFGVPNIGLRFFNVYGPGQDPASPYSGVVSIFMERALKGAQAVINGDGSASRDFVHVDDVVSCVIASMWLLEKAGRGSGHFDILNVCTGRATRIDELHMYIGEAVGNRIEPSYGPERPGDIHVSIGSPARLQRVLGIRCATVVSDGLRRLAGRA